MNTLQQQPDTKHGAIQIAIKSPRIGESTKVSSFPYQRSQTIRQTYFWSSYINKDLETFGNAYKSAIVAGYTDESARNITTKVWYKNGESFHLELLNKAEKVLLECLDMDITEEVLYRGKKTGEFKINPELARIRLETAKFVLVTLGKNDYGKK